LKAGNGEPGKFLARGMGRTKKDAEQDAARRALARLTAGATVEDETGQNDTIKVLHPADEDVSEGTPVLQSKEEELSGGTPVEEEQAAQ
jgi:hypothetical protein